MVTIDDVAAYVVERFEAPISTMKLQKLVFFAQGWSLALLKEPLFQDDFEAWRAGPVAYTLFDRHRGSHSVERWSWGDSTRLNSLERVAVDAMLKNYGALSGIQLSELTHRPETPWSEVRKRENLPEGSRSRATIEKSLIKSYFEKTLLRSSH